MNSIKFLKLNITLLCILMFSISKGQVSTVIDSNEEESLIIGTWVAENSTISDKWVFTNDNILKEYTNDILDITYSWSLFGNANSGVKSHYLEITNTNDISEKYKYEISIVDDDKLILIYQRENDMGIGKPIIYNKQ